MGNLWGALLIIKLRETWNKAFRLNKQGWLLVLLELTLPVLIFVGTGLQVSRQPFNTGQELTGVLSLFLFLGFLMTMGNGILLAQRTLFSSEVHIDRLLVQAPPDILFASLLFACLDNLRPTNQIPGLLALASAHFWFPQLQLPVLILMFVQTFLATTLGTFAVIITNRYFPRISSLTFLGAVTLQAAGIIGAIWLSVNVVQGETVFKTLIDSSVFQPLMCWSLSLLAATGIFLFVLLKMAPVWEDALLIQDEKTTRNVSDKLAQRILALLSVFRLPSPIQGVILKEWLCLWRNPLTIIRILVWLVISLILFTHPAIRSLVGSYPLIVVFTVWFFCFGELIASAYQTEGSCSGFLWLAAISPGQLVLGKLISYLPLAFFAGTAAGSIVVFSGSTPETAIWTAVLSVSGTAGGTALSLFPASLSMKKFQRRGSSITDMAFEQIPVTFWSIVSGIILGGYLGSICGMIIVSSKIQRIPWIFAVGSISLGILTTIASGKLLKRKYSL